MDWFPFEELEVDGMEVLLDTIMGPLDSPYIMRPGVKEKLDRLALKYKLLAHSNYGCDFGFDPIETTPAALRHVPLAKAIRSPWVADHCFYGDKSWLDIWSSPVQFSAAEVKRVAGRARALQEMYGMPLAHENAAYYIACPGAEMREAEFMARLVDEAGTYLHLDLHNIYTNSINLAGFDLKDYLDTIPLNRVIAIHLAGGSWMDGLYHDWHDTSVPEPVWDLLSEVMERSSPGAIIIEYQGQAHHPSTRVLGRQGDYQMILSDIDRARRVWHKACGAPVTQQAR